MKKARPARRRQDLNVRLSVEELQPRVLPNASGFFVPANAFRFHGDHVASTAPIQVSFGEHHSHESGSSVTASSSFVAVLTDPASGEKATVVYNSTTGELFVRVTGAAANASLPITINGAATPLATITANASGKANLEASESGLGIQAGSTITVGTLSGTFVAGTDARLTASLTGSTSATGKARYDVFDQQFKVTITGATAGTKYNVSVGTTVIGQITADASGKGTLKLTTADLAKAGVTLTASSTITVADSSTPDVPFLQGTLATASRGHC